MEFFADRSSIQLAVSNYENEEIKKKFHNLSSIFPNKNLLEINKYKMKIKEKNFNNKISIIKN